MRLNDEIRLKMNTGARRDKLKIVFFGGHANNFEILFGIGEIRAYFALWISLHFFFERKICSGYVWRTKIFRITLTKFEQNSFAPP